MNNKNLTSGHIVGFMMKIQTRYLFINNIFEGHLIGLPKFPKFSEADKKTS